ncbi:hypothetical protein V6R85_24135 [Agrobacterium sp. CCNWLW32]|uniref:hypothetical protein n=1 Tax=Agrobacterium sp. CCNWLW32 TaxID=3122072 RepID=UPI0030101659
MSRHLPADYRRALESLFRHRMIARVLRDRPELVEIAQRENDSLREQYGDHGQLVEWDDILKLPLPEIRQLLTSRSERMFRLRIDSPFIRPLIGQFGFDQDKQRRRILDASRRLVQSTPDTIVDRGRLPGQS